jgi:hypothetical protein
MNHTLPVTTGTYIYFLEVLAVLRIGSVIQRYGSASIIYSSRILCLSPCRPVILSVVVAERRAILYVLVIKLTKETRRRVSRGRDTDGEIGDGKIEEIGCEETFHCFSLT